MLHGNSEFWTSSLSRDADNFVRLKQVDLFRVLGRKNIRAHIPTPSQTPISEWQRDVRSLLFSERSVRHHNIKWFQMTWISSTLVCLVVCWRLPILQLVYVHSAKGKYVISDVFNSIMSRRTCTADGMFENKCTDQFVGFFHYYSNERNIYWSFSRL